MSTRRVTTATIACSALIYALVMLALFAFPECRETSIKVFGEAPLGLPWYVVQFFLVTLVFVPFPFVLWYVMFVIFDAHDNGHVVTGPIGLLRYLFSEFNHERATTYRAVILLGLLYYVVVVASWIIYAASRGI